MLVNKQPTKHKDVKNDDDKKQHNQDRYRVEIWIVKTKCSHGPLKRKATRLDGLFDSSGYLVTGNTCSFAACCIETFDY